MTFDTDGLHLPTFTTPDGRPPADYFRDLAREGLERRFVEARVDPAPSGIPQESTRGERS